MEIDLFRVLIFIATTAATVAITFYLKDYLQSKKEYSKLRKKLEKVAGKNATVLFGGVGFGPSTSQLYKIIDIDSHGITLQNELHTIFVPGKKLLQLEMIVPCDDYEKKKLEKVKKDMVEFMDALLPAMFDKLFPVMEEAMKEHFMEDFSSDKGEFSAIIGVKIQKVLSEEGYEIRKLESANKKK